MTTEAGWASRRKTLIALVAYGAIAVLMTWPLIRQLNTHLPGRGDDLLVHFWNGWWMKRTLLQGGDPYFTNLLFYPSGVSLLYHNISWANIALWLLLDMLTGAVAAFNLVYLLNLTLCGVGMYFLTRYLTRSDGAAFIAGLVYAFWPYRMYELEHPNLVATQWLPLFLLGVIQVVREERKAGPAVLTAIALIATGYTRWQLLVLAGIAAVLYGCYSLCFERQRWNVRTALAFLLIVVVSLAAMAPALLPVLQGQLTRDNPQDLFIVEPVFRQTDLLAYVVPPNNHLLAGLFDGLEYARSFERAWYSNAYLGLVAISLVALGVGRSKREAWFWVALALVAVLLALGPILRLNADTYDNIGLPYSLVEDSFPIRIMRAPRRFNMLLALPVAALAGYGVLSLVNRARGPISVRLTRILIPVLAVLTCVDYLQIPVSTFDTAISPFYQTLAAEPGDFALLHLPTGRSRSPYYMLGQMVHGRPIVEGSVARPPREAEEFVSENQFLAYLEEHRLTDPSLPDVSRQLAALAESGIRYVIISEPYAFPWEKADWRAYLAYRPAYQDEYVTVYRTDPQAGRDFDLLYDLGGGLGLVQAVSSTTTIAPASLVEVDLVWGTTRDQHEDLIVELVLADESGQGEQITTFPIVSGFPTSEWPANTLAHGAYAFNVDPRLPGGTYSLRLALASEDSGERVGDSLIVIDTIQLAMPPRIFSAPPSQVETDISFGDALGLLGYDLEVEEDTLRITLHWRALRRMDADYKFFVHLFAEDGAEPVAQADVMPRNWTYPTSWWEEGEVVSDEIVVQLGGVPSGDYLLAVGVYEPVSLEHLPARTEDGQPIPGGRAVLEEQVHVPQRGD